MLTVDVSELRRAIQVEYAEVAEQPDLGFHFLTGRPLSRVLGYDQRLLEGIPESTIESFAGTGYPFGLGALRAAERVVDIGSGAGLDSLIAARMVGPTGSVIGIDMTPAMLRKARASADESHTQNVAFREALAEALPLPDDSADVVISNGVLNLVPDKYAALSEMARVLRPGGRLQIADILVQKPVPASAKENVALWTG